MLDDQQLAAIAANLHALNLDPLTHLRVIAALAPALLPSDAPPSGKGVGRPTFAEAPNEAKNPSDRARDCEAQNIPAALKPGNGATTHGGELIGRHPRQIAAHEFQGAEQVAVVAPLIGENPSCDPTGLGQNVPAAPSATRSTASHRQYNSAVIPPKRIPSAQLDKARSCLSANLSLATNITALAKASGVSRPTAAKAILLAGANSHRAIPNPAGGIARSLSAAAARDPDAHARAFLEQRLAQGPIPAADVDAEVDNRRLCAASVECAVEHLDLVACRVNLGKGRVACYATRDQAAELGAVVAEKGARGEPATPPKLP